MFLAFSLHVERVIAPQSLRWSRVVGDLGAQVVGGIDSGEAAWTKITAGASLLQLYTGLVYEGPALVGRILTHLSACLDRHGLAHLGEASGRNAEAWAKADPEGQGSV